MTETNIKTAKAGGGSSPASCSRLHIGMAALSNRIYAGKVCKDGKTWREGKVDVTSDVLKVIVAYVTPGHFVKVHVDGKPKYEIEVREVASNNQAEPSGSVERKQNAM